MTRRPPGRRKADPIKKPSKRVLFITGVEHPSTSQLNTVRKAVATAVEHNCVIVTSDLDGIDAEIIRRTNKVKYEKILVWGASGACRYMTNFGRNEVAMYAPPQRDDVCVARTGTLIAIGKSKRLARLTKFANQISRRVILK